MAGEILLGKVPEEVWELLEKPLFIATRPNHRHQE
jgi:hypothetical protein